MALQSESGSEAGPSTSTAPAPVLDPIIDPLNDLAIDETSKTKTETRKCKPSRTKPRTEPPKAEPKLKTSKPIPTPIEAFSDPAEGEEETVHEIYESIAPHFAQTRHKVCERGDEVTKSQNESFVVYDPPQWKQVHDA
jgi:hypothetical protein